MNGNSNDHYHYQYLELLQRSVVIIDSNQNIMTQSITRMSISLSISPIVVHCGLRLFDLSLQFQIPLASLC
jgi:ABC-type glucose/galactose transport system permease subunit